MLEARNQARDGNVAVMNGPGIRARLWVRRAHGAAQIGAESEVGTRGILVHWLLGINTQGLDALLVISVGR